MAGPHFFTGLPGGAGFIEGAHGHELGERGELGIDVGHRFAERRAFIQRGTACRSSLTIELTHAVILHGGLQAV